MYSDPSNIDAFMVLQPIVVGLFREMWLRISSWRISNKKYLKNRSMEVQMGNLIRIIIMGLPEIQMLNLQSYQLERLGNIANYQFALNHGFSSYTARYFSTLRHRNLSDWITDTVVCMRMRGQGLTYLEYLKKKDEIRQFTKCGRRVYDRSLRVVNTIDNLDRARTLLQVPTFRNEELAKPRKLKSIDQIHLTRCEFGYYKGNRVVDISTPLTFERGKLYGLAGQNQSGKSTLLKLLCRLHSSDQMDFTINGVDHREYARTELRRHVSYMFQRPFLFPGSIGENIHIANPSASAEQVVDAAERAGVLIMQQEPQERPTPPKSDDDKIWQTTSGINRLLNYCFGSWFRKSRATSDIEQDTMAWDVLGANRVVYPNDALNQPVKLRGDNLSGGLAQSVALARILLRPHASVVIIDEGLGQMDAYKKNMYILPALYKFVKANNQMLLMVSHDLRDLQEMDSIVVLDKGSVAGVGTHDELYRTCDAYKQLHLKFSLKS